MQSYVRRVWVMFLVSAAAVAGCTSGNTDCEGGSTSDWPFCRSAGGGQSSEGGGGGRPVGLGDSPTTGGTGGETGGSVGTTTGTTGSAGGTGGVPNDDGDGLDVGGESPPAVTGGSTGGGFLCPLCGPGGDAGTYDAGAGDSGADAGTDADASSDEGCGIPVECGFEVDLEEPDTKSLSGSAPLDLTHGSVTWGVGEPQRATVFLRGLDAAGNEVQLTLALDEAQLAAALEPEGTAQGEAQVETCGGVDPGPVDYTADVHTLGWGTGFDATLILEGPEWRSEVSLRTLAMCLGS